MKGQLVYKENDKVYTLFFRSKKEALDYFDKMRFFFDRIYNSLKLISIDEITDKEYLNYIKGIKFDLVTRLNVTIISPLVKCNMPARKHKKENHSINSQHVIKSKFGIHGIKKDYYVINKHRELRDIQEIL
jgi:hypothetical protein